MELLGRRLERESLDHHYQSSSSKLSAVYGRRRVGKTFLVREHFKERILFEVSGLYEGNMEDQLSQAVNYDSTQVVRSMV